jgi:hypothetical protein
MRSYCFVLGVPENRRVKEIGRHMGIPEELFSGWLFRVVLRRLVYRIRT